MAFCIMNVDKQGRAAVYGLQIEANREKDDRREFDLSDIDRERTDQNYYLKKTVSWNREITKQIKEAGVKERKDAVVLITGIYTASPEYFERCTREEMEKYFQDCLDFHVREYCQGDPKRLINAVVHLDEQTPHLQVASIPLVEDEKGLHLSAKIIMGNRAAYRLRQDRFYDEVGKAYDLERGERRDPAETKAHTTKREWQIATQEGKFQETIEKTLEAQKELQSTNKQLEIAKEEIKPQIEAYNAISQAADKRQKPVIEIGKEEVKEGLLRTREEYFVKVPCKNEKDAKKLQKEVTALYDKDFAKEALNELILSKNKDLDKKRRKQQSDLAKAQKEFEKYKENTLQTLEEIRAGIVRQSEAYNNLVIDDLVGLNEQGMNELAKDSLTEALIDETVKATINILDKHNYLKQRPSFLDQMEIVKAIQKTFVIKIREFVDKVREHITEKLFRRSQEQKRENHENFIR